MADREKAFGKERERIDVLIAEQLESLRRRLRPYAEAKGILTDEDVFRMVS